MSQGIAAKLTVLSAGLLLAFGASAAIKDGVYTAKVIGHNAPMTVVVTIDGGKITNINASKNLETANVGRRAIELMTDKIIRNQSVGVDVVTGASLSSFAIKSAVTKCLQQAGDDMDAWKKNVEVYPTTPLTFSADVVVVGGGGSGLASAVSAIQNGAQRVVIVEKLGFLGGSTNVSGGAFNAVDPERQKPQGIEDSVEKFYEQTLKGGHNVGTPELIHYLTDNALDTLHWLEGMGMKFKKKNGTATGALWQRSPYPVATAGTGYVNTLVNQLNAAGSRVTILTDTQAKDLIKNKKGEVVGVKAMKKQQPVTVNAKAVVIATGGFGANIALRQSVNTGVWKEVVLDKNIGCSNIQKAAQGDGLQIGRRAGADVIGLSDIQLHPNGTPGTGLFQDIATSGRNRIFVNKDGNRFVNEGAPRDVLAKAIFANGGQYWLVMNHLRYPDKAAIDKYGISMNDMLMLGRVKEAATLEEAAKIMNVNVDNLKASIAEYNKAVRHEVEKDKYGFKSNNTEDKPLTEGPWYICPKVPTVHHTMGGLHINSKAEVLDKNGKPITGLFAAGEVTGGIHGANRLGGNAVCDIMTFGRLAGRSAAQKAAAK